MEECRPALFCNIKRALVAKLFPGIRGAERMLFRLVRRVLLIRAGAPG
jgi:hypothetical protein